MCQRDRLEATAHKFREPSQTTDEASLKLKSLLRSAESTHLGPEPGLFVRNSPRSRRFPGDAASRAGAEVSADGGDTRWVCRGGEDRIGSPVGALAAGRTLTVSRPCAECDRHPSLLTPLPRCLPLFPCPMASSPSQGKTHPTACPPKMSSSEIMTA